MKGYKKIATVAILCAIAGCGNNDIKLNLIAGNEGDNCTLTDPLTNVEFRQAITSIAAMTDETTLSEFEKALPLAVIEQAPSGSGDTWAAWQVFPVDDGEVGTVNVAFNADNRLSGYDIGVVRTQQGDSCYWDIAE